MNKGLFVAALVGCVLGCGLVMGGCSAPEGDSAAEKREFANDMAQRTLRRLYRERPAARSHLEDAPGYAVFSNVKTSFIFTTMGNGYGVAYDNKTGEEFQMRMAQAGVGIGLGIKDFYAVFVFNKRSAFDEFVDKGWEFGASGDAAAKAGDAGGSADAAGSFNDPITVYQFTESGLVVQASVAGTKYWIEEKRQN
jgi:lipid-binding SYLF domain-containing protein